MEQLVLENQGKVVNLSPMEPSIESQENSRKLFNISLEEFKVLVRNGITLDHLFLLEYFNDCGNLQEPNSKLETLRVGLIRKGYLLPNNDVTKEGLSLLNCKDIKEGVKKSKTVYKDNRSQIKSDFQRWWECYPSTDYFEYLGKEFLGSQSKRRDEAECMKHFDNLIANGLTADIIIKATEKHFEIARRSSFEKGENQLTYITNSERYLRTKAFSPYIRLITQRIHKPSTGSVDI